VFTLAGIVCGGIALMCLAMKESRPSQVLRLKVQKIAKVTGYSGLRVEEAHLPTTKEFAQTSLMLPIRLFFTEPIVWGSSFMGATVVSLIYFFAEAVPIVYAEDFGLSRRHSALVFLVIGAGVLLTFLTRLYDIRKANQRKQRNQAAESEDKIMGFLVAAPALAIGLWWFGATTPPLTSSISPAVSMVAAIAIGFASVEFDTVLSGYLTDVYGPYAASANAPMCFLRAIVSGVYPLFARQMFKGLGSSNATFILAAVATLYVAVAFGFWKYGRAIRERSSSAQKTREGAGEVVKAATMEIEGA